MPYMMNEIWPHIVGLNLFDGGLFARWSIDGNIGKLFTLLSKRNVVLIGPDYCEKLNSLFHFTHIVTPSDNVWDQYDVLETKLRAAIADKDNPVVLYCCSFVAKKLIDVLYQEMSDSITQLDIGAAFDVYCGIHSRPWHNYMEVICI